MRRERLINHDLRSEIEINNEILIRRKRRKSGIIESLLVVGSVFVLGMGIYNTVSYFNVSSQVRGIEQMYGGEVARKSAENYISRHSQTLPGKTFHFGGLIASRNYLDETNHDR